jgi:hypothetical protein
MRIPFTENAWETIRDICLCHWAGLEAIVVKRYPDILAKPVSVTCGAGQAGF